MPDNFLPQAFSRHPMLVLSVYFASGVAVARFEIDPVLLLTVLAGVSSALTFVLRQSAVAVVIPLLFIPLGLCCYRAEVTSVTPDRLKRIYDEAKIGSGEPVELEGTILGGAEPAPDGWQIRLLAVRLRFAGSEQGVSGVARLSAPAGTEAMLADYHRLDLKAGSPVRVKCRLERDERYLNPGVVSRKQLLDQQGIDVTGTIKSPLLIEKLGETSTGEPLTFVYQLRGRIIDTLVENLSPETSGVLIASLLGDKHFLDRHTADTFRDGGTYHVLIISGLHITFAGGVLLFVVSRLTRSRLLQFLVTTSLLWTYTIAVGAESPVVRACLMFTTLLFSRVIYRNGSLLNSLGSCVLILLAWRPADLFAPSFQLTVVSVAAIVGCGFPLVEKLRSIGRWTPSAAEPLPADVPRSLRRFCELLYWNEEEWKIESGRNIWSARPFKAPYMPRFHGPNLKSLLAYIFEGLLISAVVQLWMLPLLVVYFHRVSPVSLVLNLWVGVLLAAESIAAIAAVLFHRISGWLAAPLFALTEFFNRAMMSLPEAVSSVDLASFRLPVYSGSGKAIYAVYMLLVVAASAALWLWDPFGPTEFRRRAKPVLVVSSFTVVLLALWIVIHPGSAPRPDGRLRIDFLDVGQGDSALVTFPNGETMLIDGGGRPSYDEGYEADVPRIGETVVSEFLWEKGYSQIDRLVITHADADHIQGLVDVAKNFQIGEVMFGAERPEDRDFAELMSVVRRRGIPVRIVGRGETYSIGGTSLDLLNPSRETFTSTNNSSIVIRLVYGSRTFLLTGDIEGDAELRILGDDLAADVVKVPHHGSRTSSTDPFVVEVAAAVAVIPVGRKSPFGHPHPEVVERWQRSGSRVITTGEKGTVTVSTDGRDLVVGTFLK